MKNKIKKSTILNVLEDLQKDYVRLSIEEDKSFTIHKTNLDTLFLNNFKMSVENEELILEHINEL